jgi:WD40 repeat protein
LAAKGIDAWFDTRRLEPGSTWSFEIERAIDACEAMLVLMTSGSYASEICRGEQIRAGRQGKRLIPILAHVGAGGHTDSVHGVAVTPDGKRALSASSDQTLKVWDLEIGKLLASFTADAPILSCAVGPVEHVIVAGDLSGRVHFLFLELNRLSDSVSSVAFCELASTKPGKLDRCGKQPSDPINGSDLAISQHLCRMRHTSASVNWAFGVHQASVDRVLFPRLIVSWVAKSALSTRHC